MSLEDGVCADCAERVFWKIPDSHKLTRHILGKSFVWKKLIKRPFPEDVKIRLDVKSSPMPLEDDAHLPRLK